MTQGMKRVSLALAAALVATPALAIEVKAGSWDLSFTGNVNAFLTYNACDDEGVLTEGVGLACVRGEDEPNPMGIESGLLPNAFVFSAKSRQANLDVSATIGLYPGQNNSNGKVALGSPGIDVRQGFLTFGDKSWGTVKIGRDLGIFGGEAILSDMTLLGVGAGAAGLPLGSINTTLGHIGTGYIYADWIPQIAYISPSWSGFSFTVAAVEAFRIAPANSNDTPGAQARLSYDLTAGSTTGRVWLGGMYQNSKLSAPPTNPSLTSVAGELGAKVSVSGLGVLAYGYYGSGIGTTVIGLDAATAATTESATDDSIKARPSYGFYGSALGTTGFGWNAVDRTTGEERTSFGYWGQVSYQIGKLKPGVSYGASHLQEADDETNLGLLKKNATLTAGLYYALTESLNLVGEFNKTWTENQNGDDATDNAFSVGSIIFF